MADEKSEVAVEKSAEAAVAAVAAEAAVEAKIEAVQDAASDLIEIAEQRAENAESAAQAITDATIMTNLGQSLEAHKAECATWHGKVASLEMQVASLAATLADLTLRLPPVVMTPEAPSSKGPLIPPQSSKTEVVLAEDLSDAEEGDQKDRKTEPAKRRRVAL